MYGQGNYGLQFIHGPLPLPPPPPLLQQGHFPPPSPLPPIQLQQGLPPPHPSFQHGLPAPPPPIQQGPTVPLHLIQQGQVPPVPINPPGMVNMGQPFLTPPPIHGRASVQPSYSTTQQNPPYPPPMPSQNVHHGQPPHLPLSGPSPPEMTQGQLPPRVLPPPPPSQGQMLYRTPPVPLSSGTIQMPQTMRPIPPPSSGFVPITPLPYPSFLHWPISDAHPPSIPPPSPPPPPSSPPPLPPSPPPLNSPPPNFPSMVSDTASLNPTDSIMYASRSLESSVGPANSMEEIVDSPVLVERYTDHLCDTVGSAQSAGGTSQMIDSISAEEISSKALASMDAPASPSKPVNEEVSQNIELLCQFIAKAGPEFEKMARTREVGNPKFAFLFGGEPGSDAAIGHKYFQWMKKKYLSEHRLQDESEQSDPSLRTLEQENSLQLNNSVDDRFSYSPNVSDMDMEDDANPSNRGPEVYESISDLEGEPFLPNRGSVNATEQFHSPQRPLKRPIPEDAMTSSAPWTGRLTLHAEQEKGDDGSASANPFIEDLSPVKDSLEATECTSDAIVQESTSSHIQVSNPVRAVPDAAEVLGTSNSGGGIFKLIPDYASDDSADDDEGPYIEDVSPVRVLPEVTVGASDVGQSIEDVGPHPCSDLVDMKLSARGTGSVLKIDPDPLDPSITPPKITEIARDFVGSPVSHKAASPSLIHTEPLNSTAETNELGTCETPDIALIGDYFEGNDVDAGPESGRFHQEEDLKQVSPKLKVDEFGRLVREGCSGNESDISHDPEWRRKRGRSWSRSRSPLGSSCRRSHSPWRRKDKRSRFRSWSPKKGRSRSKSPAAYRRSGEKSLWDGNQTPECFNFLRGRCHRGASCRFLHRDSTREDSPRRYSGKVQQRQESPNEFINSVMDTEESKYVAAGKDYGENDALYQERKGTEILPAQDLSVGGGDAKMAVDLDGKTESNSDRDLSQTSISSELVQALVNGESGQSQVSQETIDQVQEPHQVQQLQEEPNTNPLATEISQQSVEIPHPSSVNTFPIQPLPVTEVENLTVEALLPQPHSGEAFVLQHYHASDSGPDLQNFPPSSQYVQGSSVLHPFPVQTYPAATFHSQDPLAQQYPPNQAPLSQPYVPNQGPVNQPLPLEKFGSQHLPPQESFPSTYSSFGFRFQPSQVPAAPHPPGKNLNPQLPSDYQLQIPAGNFQSKPTPIESFSPYQPSPNDYQRQHRSPNPSWINLPLPPPFRDELLPKPTLSAMDLRPLPFQQSPMIPRSDFSPQPLMRPYLPDDPSHLRPGDFSSRTFPPIEELHQTALPKEEFRSSLLHFENPRDQPYSGSGFMREVRFSGPTGVPQTFSRLREDYRLLPQLLPREEVRGGPFPSREDPNNLPNSRFSSQFSDQGFTSSTAFAQESVHSQPPQYFSRDPLNLRDGLPSRTFPREDYSTAAFSQFGAPSNIEPSRTGYHTGLPASIPPVRSHHNPFASTFEQTPSGSAFSSGIFRHEIEANSGSKYESQFGSSRDPLNGQGDAGVGSRTLGLPKPDSPLDSGRFRGQFLPRSGSSLIMSPANEPNGFSYPRESSAARRSGEPPNSVKESAAGDQYDPLLDSIEPSSNEVIRKFDRVQEREASIEAANKSVTALGEKESGITLGPDTLPKLMDEENHKQKAFAPIVLQPPETDEFGEVAIDGKMGAVDNGSPQLEDLKNWSPGQDIDMGNMAAGEIEIDQVQIPSRSKKSKDSRSMKLFKIALADFVKEVLKPSWRQGNMSKEAFKTIVKKTVDKVSGAMQSHQIPKTQGKINQYVESSQQKLTKLVMGYVDKYVKA